MALVRSHTDAVESEGNVLFPNVLITALSDGQGCSGEGAHRDVYS